MKTITPLGNSKIEDDYYQEGHTFQQNGYSTNQIQGQSYPFDIPMNIKPIQQNQEKFKDSKEQLHLEPIGNTKKMISNKSSTSENHSKSLHSSNPFDDEEINFPNQLSPVGCSKIMPTSSVFIPSLHKRKPNISKLPQKVGEQNDSQMGSQIQQSSKIQQASLIMNENSKEKKNEKKEEENTFSVNGQKQKEENKIFDIENKDENEKFNMGGADEKDEQTQFMYSRFVTYRTQIEDDKQEKVEKQEGQQIDKQSKEEEEKNDYYEEEGDNRQLEISDRENQGFWERSNGERKQSLFKNDPSMFQPVSGYFFPNPSLEAANAFDWEMALQSIGVAKFKSEEKRKKYIKFINIYLKNKKREYIQRINRDISGLKSAENMGDYFMKRYQNDQEKRVAGCAQAQNYPVYIGVRGDGNCFYRGVIVSYLVHLISNEKGIEEFEHLIEDIENGGLELVDLEYQGIKRNDKDKVKTILLQHFLIILAEIKKVQDQLETAFIIMKMFDKIAEDHDFDYSLVCLCRSMILMSLDKFAQNEIYKEYLLSDDLQRTKIKLTQYREDAEYHVLSLSTEVFRYPLQILSLQKDKKGHAEFSANVTFSPQISEVAQKNKKIYLLLSDGHYDLVFDKATCLDFFLSLSLFNQHKKYKEDLIQLSKNEERGSVFVKLLQEYEEFIKEQNEQISRIRQSFVNLQTISNPDKNIEQELNLFDTMMNKIGSNSNLDNPITSDKNQAQIFQNNQEKGNSNKENKKENVDQIVLHLEEQHSAPNQRVSLDNHQQKSEILNPNEDHQLQNFPSFSQQNDPSLIHYYSLGSDKVSKYKAANSLRSEQRNSISLKEKTTTKFPQSQNACPHAAESSITIDRLICCKQNLSVCYPCFKTRQIIPCPVCKKDIFSEQKIASTSKLISFACKGCSSLNPQIVPLFNKVFCQFCNIQNNHI